VNTLHTSLSLWVSSGFQADGTPSITYVTTNRMTGEEGISMPMRARYRVGVTQPSTINNS
jgi:hypothetical protein